MKAIISLELQHKSLRRWREGSTEIVAVAHRGSQIIKPRSLNILEMVSTITERMKWTGTQAIREEEQFCRKIKNKRDFRTLVGCWPTFYSLS